ncbi:MAG: hypothetical protein K0S51_1216 [Bacillales bacterium]|jgi:hypothetical protein|nr:hypothetical protein [Bacillales bacterium]
MKNKKIKLILIIFIIATLIPLLLFHGIDYYFTGYNGTESGRKEIENTFLKTIEKEYELNSSDIKEMKGNYDIKISDYYVSVRFMNEPKIKYSYYKSNNGFSQMFIYEGKRQITEKNEINYLKNGHVFSIENNSEGN